MKNKTKSTFSKMMEDPSQKEKFEKEYSQFMFSELLLAAMEENQISVRLLAKESGVSTSTIQNMRAMKPANITLRTVSSLLSTLGYELEAKKGNKVVTLSANF
ncbi:MAG: helix-turn-helix domain-containing protein [Candidatus Marinimicrobia bacterium]|nr:helix-turn-helix domain-containing protein [Candidatus Neomarinimicrobiota bacterium]